MYKESNLAIEGGFNHPDSPGSVTITDTQTTTFETPEELTSYLDKLKTVKNILYYGGYVTAVSSPGAIMGGLAIDKFDVSLLGFASLVIGISSGYRGAHLDSRLRHIYARLEFNRVTQVKVNSEDAPQVNPAEEPVSDVEPVGNSPENLSPSISV